MMQRLCLVFLALTACGDTAPERVAPPGSADPTEWRILEHRGDRVHRVRDPRNGIVFVVIPAGTFRMGGKTHVDGPVHDVEITHPFLLAETELTTAQWQRYQDESRGRRAKPPGAGGDLPAAGMSHLEASEFCRLYGYQLPTEAQWEYAARGGARAGEGPWRTRAGIERLGWVYTNADRRVHPVGQREPNGFGLFDMLGNVWEWCADAYADGYPDALATGRRVDPAGPSDSPLRVIRGGSWHSTPAPWPSDRVFAGPASGSSLIGFRPACRWPGD